MMRERMERLLGLPFSAGCISHSSIAVIENPPRIKTPTETNPSSKDGEEDQVQVQVLQTGGKMKNSSSSSSSSSGFLPRANNISAGLQRLMKSFKGLSQLFTVNYKEEEEDDQEMDIGLPTDVKHVAHIGWDGSNNVSAINLWDRGPELLALPSISLRQFELAMAAQADTTTPA